MLQKFPSNFNLIFSNAEVDADGVMDWYLNEYGI